MQGEFTGLKCLILNEIPCAYYVHSFVHQLQLALLGVAKSHVQITLLFNIVSSLTNIVRALCKRRDLLYPKQLRKVVEVFSNYDIFNSLKVTLRNYALTS